MSLLLGEAKRPQFIKIVYPGSTKCARFVLKHDHLPRQARDKQSAKFRQQK